MEQLQNSIQNTNGFMFMLLMKIVGNINFEGSLTAGEILAPSLSNVVYKVLSFLILFLSLMIILGLVKLLLNKILSICYGNFLNKTLGFCVGLLQGLIIFGIIFFVLSILANLFLNENLLIFINSGKVSQFVYKNIIIKGIEFLF